jgi:Regulator of ribonuclease activity B
MVAVDWLGFFLPRFGTRKPLLESLSPPAQADLERLDELREMGSRLALPHPVRAYLAFPTEAVARGAREQLQKEGFNCQLRASADGSWVVTAILQLVPTPGAITRLREQLEEVASAMSGSYRGWDAPLVY